MALPEGFLDELKTRLSLGQVAGRKVIWDSRKSNPAKGDYWSPCPFHAEKTASFHVDDAKGFYYCFGCHAKGDALSFVRETENVGFMEAVEILANEAGMPVPKQDPKAQEQAKKRSSLFDVMELAVQFYRLQFNAAQAATAREYIANRGLSQKHIERFEIGYAPQSRTALFEHLKTKGIEPAQMDEAGLIIIPDTGTPFDRFRDRIMFPIRDGRGRPTAFGGRALSADAKAKYLNSPETPLFDKGRSLYNHQPAREAAGKAQSLIVAEGYMDVIALCNYGFEHSVAPLGTAITPDQLGLMWRIADEPIIALDGDKAGLRAAMRLIDVALPSLVAGKSLRFALMPDGLDPDDLLRNSGAAAMQNLLDNAIPMVSLLWRRETEDRTFDSPERKAALDASLKKTLSLIEDPSIRDHYRADFRERRFQLFTPQRPQKFTASAPLQRKGNFGKNAPARPQASTKSSLLARSDGATAENRIRETAILRTAIKFPQTVATLQDQLETLPFTLPELARLRDHLLDVVHSVSNDDLNHSQIVKALSDKGDGAILASVLHAGAILDRTHTDKTDDLRAQMSRHRAIVGRSKETHEAELEITGVDDEGVTWRLSEANKAQEAAARLGFDDGDDNNEKDAENSRFLQQMIDDQSWIKKKH